MSRLIVKIGGSVFSDLNAYQTQATLIRGLYTSIGPEQLLIVVSAMSGETQNSIDSYCEESGACPDLLSEALHGNDRYESHDTRNAARDLLQPEIDSAYWLSTLIPDSKVFEQGMDSYPILANTSRLCAEVDWGLTEESAADLKNYRGIGIVAGYGARHPSGGKSLLGRNASDLVAAWCARLCESDRLVYLKDVPGVYENFGQANQRLLSEMQISRENAGEVGKVLHHKVIEPLYGTGIEVVVGHFNSLLGLARGIEGTRILFH